MLFNTAGSHIWTVPDGITSVDVFLVGGGGAGLNGRGVYKAGGGGGYTKTFRGTGYVAPASGTWETLEDRGRDGNAITVSPGENIQVIVGAGGYSGEGGYSQFKNNNYVAAGGKMGTNNRGGEGGSAGSMGTGGSDGASDVVGVAGQGHTTRDFGELSGKRNAGGGGGEYAGAAGAGVSDYTEGSGQSLKGYGGGGYGGGSGGGTDSSYGRGGSGKVMIRYYTRK